MFRARLSQTTRKSACCSGSHLPSNKFYLLYVLPYVWQFFSSLRSDHDTMELAAWCLLGVFHMQGSYGKHEVTHDLPGMSDTQHQSKRVRGFNSQAKFEFPCKLASYLLHNLDKELLDLGQGTYPLGVLL